MSRNPIQVLRTEPGATGRSAAPSADAVLPRPASDSTHAVLPGTNLAPNYGALNHSKPTHTQAGLLDKIGKLRDTVLGEEASSARRLYASLRRLDLNTEERASIERIVQGLPKLARPIAIKDAELVGRINGSFKQDLWEGGHRSVLEMSPTEFFRFAAGKARVSFLDRKSPINTDGGAVFKAFCEAGYSFAEQTEVLLTLLRSRNALFRHSAAAGENLGAEKFNSDMHSTITAASYLGRLPGKKAVGALIEFLNDAPASASPLLATAKLRAAGGLQEIAAAAAKVGEQGLLGHLRTQRPELESLAGRLRTSNERAVENEITRLVHLLNA